MISTESERKPRKKTICLIHGWIHAWTCSRKQQMHNSWIFTVFSNMANHSFNFFVSFSINDWKENVESLNYYPILRRKVQPYLFLSTHREWDGFFVASCKCCQQRPRSRWALFICSAVFLAMLACWHLQFSKILAFLFLLHKLTSISRQNWSCEEFPSSQNSVKAASFSSVVVNKTLLRHWK